MKTILFKIGLISILAFLTLGCSQKIEKTKSVTIDYRLRPMWGVALGCQRADIANGFTKKGCLDANLSWGTR